MRFLPILLAALTACSDDQLHRAIPEVEVDTRVGFGNPYVGDTVSAQFGIHSVGSGRVRVTAITCTDPELRLEWNDRGADRRGAPLDPGHTLEVTVTWRPTSPGGHQSTIQVDTDVEDSEHWVVNTLGWARELPSCDDGNPCTSDSFDRNTESCVHVNNSLPCDDGNACTRDDECFDGECRGIAEQCDDDDICTFNLCDPASGCYFPPDPIVCDDGDPCTDNVCDPDDGCSFPQSDNGTPCGSFDCAIGHFCFFGSCRPWDISDQAEGSPCTDGDRCTDGDVCHDGECQSGPVIQTDPEIVATVETFGGTGSTVATDGHRYLFADADRMRLTVVDLEGALEQTATLEVVATSRPVLFAPGRFVVGAGANLLFIDATDVEAPSVVWSRLAADYGVVAHLARGTDGVVYALDTGSDINGFIVPPEQGPYFLPIAADGTPGTSITLASDYDIRDLDADGHSVAWISGSVMHYLEHDSSGSVSVYAQYPSPTQAPLRRVSVEGQSVAVLGSDIGVYRIVSGPVTPNCTSGGLPCEELSPGCGEPALPEPGLYAVDCGSMQAECPIGTTCRAVSVAVCEEMDCDACGSTRDVCIPDPVRFEPKSFISLEVNDLAIASVYANTSSIGVELYVTGPAGTERVESWQDLDSYGVSPEDRAYSYWTTPLDPLNADRLDATGGHVLLSGPIALPLRFPGTAGDAAEAPGAVVPLTRITGPRHGSVRAIVDASETSVLVAGEVAVGRIDVLESEVVSWWLTDRAASKSEPRLLRGLTRDAAITHEVDWLGSSYYPTVESPIECRGSLVQVLDADGLGDLIACDHVGGTQAVAGNRLWAFGPLPPMDSIDSRLRAWSLDGGLPVFDWLPFDATPTEWWSTRVRASSSGDAIATISPVGDWAEQAATGLRVVVFDVDAGGNPMVADAQLPVCAGTDVPALFRVATDGTRALVGDGNALQLWDLLGVDDPVGPTVLDIPEADPNAHLGVPWMAAGRAWVSWNAGIDSLPDGPALTQVTYGTAFERDGDLLLDQPVEETLDAGEVTIVTTRTAVHLVSPACR